MSDIEVRYLCTASSDGGGSCLHFFIATHLSTPQAVAVSDTVTPPLTSIVALDAVRHLRLNRPTGVSLPPSDRNATTALLAMQSQEDFARVVSALYHCPAVRNTMPHFALTGVRHNPMDPVLHVEALHLTIDDLRGDIAAAKDRQRALLEIQSLEEHRMRETIVRLKGTTGLRYPVRDNRRHQGEGLSFPPFPNTAVTLYQSAHTFSGLPRFHTTLLSNNCWVDMYDALVAARSAVYIMGWRLDVDLILLRGQGMPNATAVEPLGDLLKRKARNGVKVRILIWQAPVGHGHPLDDNRRYFHGTGVEYRNVSRATQSDDEFWAHNEKVVLCDGVAFLGGLDLCKGRWDNADKRLVSVPGLHDVIPGLPVRTPWHDTHCRLEGEVVRGLYSTMLQRWRRQVEDVADFIPSGVLFHTNIRTRTTARIVRSLDVTSAVDVGVVDHGLYTAMTHHISTARRFLYIETELFVSIDSWNKIAETIVARVHRAIDEDEAFSVYLLVPLVPEGANPASPVSQFLMLHQFESIRRMYNGIGAKIHASRRKGFADKHPLQYLTVYTLGAKENGLAGFIHVHSNLLIADDNVLVMGSGSMTDRSLRGDRNTEIGVVVTEDSFDVMSTDSAVTGEIQNYRLSLWTEHMCLTGTEELASLRRPHSAVCVTIVYQRALTAWEQYAHPASGISSRMIPFPVVVDGHGSVREACPFIPGTNIPIRGVAPSHGTGRQLV